MVVLTPEQSDVLSRCMEWAKSPAQHFTVGGHAGTGKSTLLSILLDSYPDVPVAAFTGKAAYVLRTKGIERAQTLHSLLYRSFKHRDGRWVHQLKSRSEIKAPFVAIDEGSMLSLKLWKDLKALNLPCLIFGDHGQLPPIGDSPLLMENPMARLETIHRQALGSPIIALSQAIRAKQPFIDPSPPRLHYAKSVSELACDTSWQFIVGFNQIRHEINRTIRRLLQRSSPAPEVGDRMICLANNQELNLFNGLIGTIEALEKSTESIDFAPKDYPGFFYRANLRLEDGSLLDDVPVSPTHFLTDAADKTCRQLGYFDYAYAITCHKAQGSQFPSVVVIDSRADRLWDLARWRYTAVTRASENLIFVSKESS